MRTRVLFLLTALACSGCTGNILGTDERQILSQPSVSYTGLPKPWYLYSDDLQTGAWLDGLDFWAGGNYTGTPSIVLNSTNDPHGGARCIKFSNPGPQTTGGAGWWGCGMILLQAPGFTASNAAPGADISAGGYTRCKFWARVGSGSSPVSFEACNATANVVPVLTTTWQEYSIDLSSGASQSAMTAVKQFFAANLGSGVGSGTVTPLDIYIDDVRYE